MFERLEKTLGLPRFSEAMKVMENIPDDKRLKAIKQVLIIAERVARSAPELDQVITLIKEINSMPLDKLERLEKLLKRIEGIMKKAPQDLIEFLTSLKEE